MEFYPSITENILEEVKVSAKQHTEIAEKDIRIIKHCRKSLLYHEDKHGKGKNQRAALTLRWEAMIALKSVNLLEFIFYQNFQIFYHKKKSAYTGMMF